MPEMDEARIHILASVMEAAEQRKAHDSITPDQLPGLIHRYYRDVAFEDLTERDPVDLYGAVAAHYQLAAVRQQGTANVRVFTPTFDKHGWSSGHTVVEVVTDHMPFLVDSVTAELTRLDRAIHLVVHPQMAVRRDITGNLLEVAQNDEPRREERDAQRRIESWIHVQIDRISDPQDLAGIEMDLQRVLRDVRHAVEDSDRMRDKALRIAEELEIQSPPCSDQELLEARDLLRWLADTHFVFLGYREYSLDTENGGDVLRVVSGTGLGILRSEQVISHSFALLPPDVRTRARDKTLLTITKSGSRSTVHRPVYMDFIGVRKFDEKGEVIGERRFLGLFSHSAHTVSVLETPVLRRKAHEVFEATGFSPTNYSGGQDLLEALETYPRDELFNISTEELLTTVESVLRLKERRATRLFLRRDAYGRYVSALVYLPRDRYNTEVRERMQGILKEELHGSTVDYTSLVSESVLARVHFVVRLDPAQGLVDVDSQRLEHRLTAATRAWREDFVQALIDQCGEDRAAGLMRKYLHAFPESYKEAFSPRVAVADLRRLEELPSEGGLGMNLYAPISAGPRHRRFKVYRTGTPVSLSDALPILQSMGVEVVDERPYKIEPRDTQRDSQSAWIYDFGLRYDPSIEETEATRAMFQEAFAAVWDGSAESDWFNALVLHGGLDWRQVSVLRAYAKYLRQAGTTFSQDYIEQVLVHHVRMARMLVRLFEARFDPAREGDRSAVTGALVGELTAALDEVQSLDDDRIMRSFLTLIQATLRTSYFQTYADGDPRPYISFKLNPQAIPDLPLPRPKVEIFVYSPRVEGVHLRFGPVARGGLRWSDRREDFRTEVLGLVKAQMVKNAVIVPVGAKGGFVVKRPPANAAPDRDAYLAEGVECYRMFISGLLDLTDNLVSGTTVPPPQVVRHDSDDAYLVVAADKGTATFSDIANGVAKEYGLWLGDGFASGGSAGYDHKTMGITARGAWESVRRHFREMGVDCQNEDVTVIGVGDMSGDVFGNGMLLSEHIRLVAAFDHRHIFLDPDPDPATSLAERQRLFAVPRSTWANYDHEKISAGGGVYPRTVKSIPITEQVRERLGIHASLTKLTPNELIRAILLAPVDLLWNGGIGTYVKSSLETHANVGDKANDAIRVNANQLRAKCVAEGGNLGFTQLGRVEYALSVARWNPRLARSVGGRINTDAIDNSAGVDCSDHEVNIKILLNRLVADGDLTEKQRDRLLADMADEVTELVLRNNRDQNVAISNSLAQASNLLHVHEACIQQLHRDGVLDRDLEFLPSDKQLAQRRADGVGLTGPEFAVLVAYTKIALDRQIVASDLPDSDALRGALHQYFPTALRDRYPEQIEQHPLRREIISTRVVNNVVNSAGTTFVHRMRAETGAEAPNVLRAHIAATQVFDLTSHELAVETLDNLVPAAVQTRMRLEARRLADRGSRWLLLNRHPPLDISRQVSFFRTGVADVVALLPKLLRGSDQETMERNRDELVEAGVPGELAAATAAMNYAYSAFDIVEVTRTAGAAVEEVADVYFYLADVMSITALLARINSLPQDTHWKMMASAALRDDLFSAHAGLTHDVLIAVDGEAAPSERFAAWKDHSSDTVAQAQQRFEEITASEHYDLAMMSVALRMFRTLLHSNRD